MAIVRNFTELKGNISNIDFQQLLIAFCILVLFYVVHTKIWVVILSNLNTTLFFREAFKILMYSLMGKYIPGKVWAIGGRIYLSKKEDVSTYITMTSVIMETGLNILSGIIIFIIGLYFEKNSVSFDFKFLWIFTVLLIIFLEPHIFFWSINYALSKLNMDPVSSGLSYMQILLILGYYIVSWLILGLGFFFLTNSVVSVEFSKILFLTGAFAIADIVGFLVLVIPAGIGVKEGVLSFILISIIPASGAVAVALLARLWLIVVEGVLVLFIYLTEIYRKKAPNISLSK